MKELRGMPVVRALAEGFRKDIKILSENEITPTLAIVRIGSREDDLAYEHGIIKRFASVGAHVRVVELPLECTQSELENVICDLNGDPGTHGILMFRPLPKHLSEDRIKHIIDPAKDVDCLSLMGYAGLFTGDKSNYPPCTPQAVVDLLDYYNIDVTGKKVAIVGRSLVVGKPLAILLLEKNATVTVCHTKTRNLAEECRSADILIAAAGAANMITSDFVHPDQIIIDVGINMEQGKLCGDVDYAQVAPIVSCITPVPGGVGTVTSSVILKHTIRSAMRSNGKKEIYP